MCCPGFHTGQRVIPERIHFDRFPMPGSDHPITNFGIHPGELYARSTTMQQTISRINADTVDGAFNVPSQ